MLLILAMVSLLASMDETDGRAEEVVSKKGSSMCCTTGDTAGRMAMGATSSSLGEQITMSLSSSSHSSRIVAEELVLATPESRFHSSRGEVRGDRGDDDSDDEGEDRKAGWSSTGGATMPAGGTMTMGRW